MNRPSDSQRIDRRTLLTGAATGAAAMALGVPATARAAAEEKTTPPTPTYSLNTGTIRGQKLSLVEEVEIAAKAGYQGIEPWVSEIKQYVDGGGKPADLKKRIGDLGLVVPSAIGFADWIGDDPARRATGLEQWKRDAELVASIGGLRMAAPPAGAYKTVVPLAAVAERYRALVDLSRPLGIVPEVELWGGAKTLSRLGDVAYVLAEAGRAEACAVLDVFHVYKGGSEFAGLRAFNGAALPVFHVNDYPADPPREKATDADRVYPGDGVAPWPGIIRDLRAIGFRGMLSLELFNRTYWQQDALAVARAGLAKIRAIAER